MPKMSNHQDVLRQTHTNKEAVPHLDNVPLLIVLAVHCLENNLGRLAAHELAFSWSTIGVTYINHYKHIEVDCATYQ